MAFSQQVTETESHHCKTRFLFFNVAFVMFALTWYQFKDYLTCNDHAPTYLLLPLDKWGLKRGRFPLGNGVYLIMKKAPSDSPIWQLKKRELLLPLSFLITKPLKLDLSNLHY